MKTYKTVNAQGLQWRVCSANERTITHAGRHFFAMRCRSGRPWMLEELDQCIATHGTAKTIRDHGRSFEIGELSDAVRIAVGEIKAPAPIKLPARAAA